MSLNLIVGLLVVGLIAGYVSGLVGIGGGILVAPALIIFFGFNQHTAQGTTLAMLVPPIGILAAWGYYKQGVVDIKFALIICIGFVIGGFLGSKLALGLPENLLRKIFAGTVILIGVRMFFYRN
jgi:uncharacterized membrane protein YfcA